VIKDSAGQVVQSPQTYVETRRQSPSGTFDFDITNGQYVDVDIEPQNFSNLGRYTPAGWSCTAGNVPRSFTTIPIPGAAWSGIRVRVSANEAVSCIQAVTYS